jgi:hypothetical protein
MSMAHYTQPPRAPELSEERIEESGRIGRILRAIARSGVSGKVISNGTPIRTVAVLSDPAGAGSKVRWSYGGPGWSGSTRVELAGRHSLYACDLEFGEAIDGRLTTSVPRRLERVRCRANLRTAAPVGVTLRFAAHGGRAVERSVCDISRRGISFLLGARDSIATGDELANAYLNWQGRLRIRTRVIVRHISERMGDGAAVAGAMVFFDSEDDAENLQVELEKLNNPTTRTGSTWTRDIWDLFERSGYFSLSQKKPADFQPLEAEFRATSRKLARSPELGVQVVWPSSRGVEASASVAVLNRHSVFLYHVARRHGETPPGTSGRTILFDVYQRAIEWIAGRSYARWVVVWVQDVSRLPKRIHLDFVSRYEATRKAGHVTFRAIEVSVHEKRDSGVRIATSLLSAVVDQAEWITRDVRPAEIDQLVAAANAQWPSCVVAALDLPPSADPRSHLWDDASMTRERRFLVSEQSGQVQAFAIVDYAESGLHLFGLFDVVRIVSVGRSADQATVRLLEHVKGLFAARGKSSFIYACESAQSADELSTAGQDLGQTHCTVMSTELLPDFAEYVWELMHGAPD